DAYSVPADVILPSGSSAAGIGTRSSDPANFGGTLYTAQLSTAGTLSLYRRNSSTSTLLSSVPAGIMANATYTVKLLANGNNPVHLTAWLNGAQQISYDDSSSSRIITGLPGLVSYDPGAKFGNFTVDGMPTYVF